MSDTALLYPLFAMVFVTFGASFWLISARFKAAKAGETKLSYFKFNQGETPNYAKQAEQHYINLFEMPVLFYVLILLAFVTQITHFGLIILAWMYVAMRLAHTYVHLGSNHVLHRMRTFLASKIILVLMWLWVLIAVVMR